MIAEHPLKVYKTAGKFNVPLFKYKKQKCFVECFWCHTNVVSTKITKDHVIPLACKSRYLIHGEMGCQKTVASCKKCNEKRGIIPTHANNRKPIVDAINKRTDDYDKCFRVTKYNYNIQSIIQLQAEVCEMEKAKLGYSVSDIFLLEPIMEWEIKWNFSYTL